MSLGTIAWPVTPIVAVQTRILPSEVGFRPLVVFVHDRFHVLGHGTSWRGKLFVR